jgi:SpoVK/Ycf46/Vps4 family AAA+-type ATPase
LDSNCENCIYKNTKTIGIDEIPRTPAIATKNISDNKASVDSVSSQKKRKLAVDPISETERPIQLTDFIGQENLMSDSAPLKLLINSGKLISMIFWGPPGVGKTTLARLIGTSSTINLKIQGSNITGHSRNYLIQTQTM